MTTIEPEIQGSIDAISTICARSAYSLADEYGAHLPPQGEIRDGVALPVRGHHGLWIRTAGLESQGGGAALSIVHEASSSSGASETGTMRSAYGSLREVLMHKGKGPLLDGASGIEKFTSHSKNAPFAWAVVRKGDNSKESIMLVGSPRASRQLSMTLVIERASEDGNLEPVLASSLPPTPSAGMPSWLLPWRRPASISDEHNERPSAESALRNLFMPTSSANRAVEVG